MRACFVLLLLTATAVAEDPPTPAVKLDALKKADDDADKAFRKVMEPIPDTPEGHKQADVLYKAYDKAKAERFQSAVDLAKAEPKSDFALAALEWVLTIPRSYYVPPGLAAMELTTEHHAADPKVGKLVAVLGYVPPHPEGFPKEAAAAMTLFKAVAEKNPDKTARGQAHLALARQVGGEFTRAEYTKAADLEAKATAAEAAWEKLLKEYGECPWLRPGPNRGTIGDFAKQELVELRQLRIGKVALDIEGEGVDGTKFKLSDSRGKVTVLVFWAKWCGPCMAMVPHERTLVERMKDKPFAMVGVNGDDKLDDAKAVMAEQKMTWRSFWNGTGGPQGAITAAWNVRSWPTVYVLDPKGVIRYKHVREKELDAAVDALLKEMDAKK